MCIMGKGALCLSVWHGMCESGGKGQCVCQGDMGYVSVRIKGPLCLLV